MVLYLHFRRVLYNQALLIVPIILLYISYQTARSPIVQPLVVITGELTDPPHLLVSQLPVFSSVSSLVFPVPIYIL